MIFLSFKRGNLTQKAGDEPSYPTSGNNIQKHLMCSSSTISQIAETIIPFFCTRRDTQAIRTIGSKRICDIIASIRNSEIHHVNYNEVRDTWKIGLENDAHPPSSWEPRRAPTERFIIDDELRIGDWAPIIDALVLHGRHDPNSIEKATDGQFTALTTANTFPPLGRQIWRAFVLVFTYVSEGRFATLKGFRIKPISPFPASGHRASRFGYPPQCSRIFEKASRAKIHPGFGPRCRSSQSSTSFRESAQNPSPPPPICVANERPHRRPLLFSYLRIGSPLVF